MKKRALVVFVLMSGAVLAFGESHPEAEVVLVDPGGIVDKLMMVDIRGELYVDDELQDPILDSISQVFESDTGRYVIHDLHVLVPSLKDDRLLGEYRPFNKGLARGQQIVFYPIPNGALESFLGLIEAAPESTSGLSASPVGARIVEGRIRYPDSGRPQDAHYLELLDKAAGTSYTTSVAGAKLGVVLFNLDIYQTKDDTEPGEDAFIIGQSYLNNDLRMTSDDRFNRFADDDQIRVSVRFNDFRSYTDSIVGIINGNSELLGDPQLPNLDGPVFLEEWTNIRLDNPYVIRAMEPARDGSLYEVYATDAGLWFPVSLLETLGEIQDLGDSEYRILKWPADDRSHCGG